MKSKESTWGIIKDILLALGVILLLGLVITFILDSTIKNVRADEFDGKPNIFESSDFSYEPKPSSGITWFPGYPIAWIGAEYDLSNEKVTCQPDGANFNGNVGVRQGVMDWGPARINGVFQHHSCAFSSDSTDYNAIGLNLEFDFGKIRKYWQ